MSDVDVERPDSAHGEPPALSPAPERVSLRSVAPPPPTGVVDRIVRFGRGMGVALAILLFWTAAFGLAWVALPYVSLREREPLARRRRMQRLVARSLRWFLGMLDVTTLYRCRYQGDLSQLSGPVVLVANHPTLLDITVILSRLPSVCCVAKSSLANSPLVGRFLRACGHLSAGDGSMTAGMSVLEGARTRLREGSPVLIFPEGTRSPFGGLHPFRRGAFQIAERAGVPVRPLFLHCDPPALGKGTPVWLHPRRCPELTLSIGHELATKGCDPRELCKSVEQDFRSRLGALNEQNARKLPNARVAGEQDT